MSNSLLMAVTTLWEVSEHLRACFNCGDCIFFLSSYHATYVLFRLLPLSLSHTGKYCTEHKTTNYPNVKFFRADEDGDKFEWVIRVTVFGGIVCVCVNPMYLSCKRCSSTPAKIFTRSSTPLLHAITVYNPDHGTTATAHDLLNIEGFVKRLSTAHSEL